MPVLSSERRCRETARSAPRRLRKSTKSEAMSRQAVADAMTQTPPVRRTSTTPSALVMVQTSGLIPADAIASLRPRDSPEIGTNLPNRV